MAGCVCVWGRGEERWGRGGEEENCDICDMAQSLNPSTKKDFMQFSKRYSPETRTFSNDIACNLALCEKKVEKAWNSHNSW